MINIDWNEAGRKISEAMLRRSVSASWVAHKAGVDRKTVDRVRKGDRIRLQSLSCIEEVLGISIISPSSVDSDERSIAPVELGAYSKIMHIQYIGRYFMFRKSYDFRDRVICSSLEINWSDRDSCLEYTEQQSNDRNDGKRFRYEFQGKISIPPNLSITQFIGSGKHGFYRLMTTTSLRGQDAPYFKGILLGINEISDIGYVPATSPVFIEKIGTAYPDDYGNRIGSFHHDDLWHKTALQELKSVRGHFAAF